MELKSAMIRLRVMTAPSMDNRALVETPGRPGSCPNGRPACHRTHRAALCRNQAEIDANIVQTLWSPLQETRHSLPSRQGITPVPLHFPDRGTGRCKAERGPFGCCFRHVGSVGWATPSHRRPMKAGSGEFSPLKRKIARLPPSLERRSRGRSAVRIVIPFSGHRRSFAGATSKG